MHLLSCEHPQRIYNKYIGDYVWTRCNQCPSCRNARAAKWMSRIERERTFHRYSFFVTLTYDNNHLPVLTNDGIVSCDYDSTSKLCASKDDLQISYVALKKDYCDDDKERALLDGFLSWIGLPYASSNDLQLFHKRLNKKIHDKYTKKYQNFRYFVCSEYGSTTLRPHFHGIYFVDDSEVAEHFSELVSDSWRQGRLDCQYVEKSAGAYVAQYVNKSEGLPKFYLTGEIRQRFYFSRFPTIGTLPQSDEEVQKSFSLLSLQRVDSPRANSNKVVLCQNDSAFENRLYPKCFQYKSLTDTCRIKLYTVICRFPALGVGEFCELVRRYFVRCESINFRESSDYFVIMSEMLGDVSCLTSEVYTWLRRVYYTSKRFMENCKRFGLSVFDYYQRIKDYWNKKELFVLGQFYKWQSDYAFERKESDSLVLMYPEYCYNEYGKNWKDFLVDNFNPYDVRIMVQDALNYSVSNRLTHFKNAYLDFMSLSDNKPIYKQIKRYVYAKKCNEINQTVPSSWSE